MNDMQVYHFILDHRIGGPHVYVKTICEKLDYKIKSIIVTTGRGLLTDIALLNLRHILKFLYPLEILFNTIQLCWRFRHGIIRIGVVFDVHGAANIAPILAARILNIPVVWHFHETYARFNGFVKLGKILLSGIPHRYVVVSEMSSQIFKIASSRLIPGGVDVNFWKLDKANVCKIKCNNHRLRLIAVGNLNPLKGLDILFDALSGLDEPWDLVVVGAELNTFNRYAANLYMHGSRLKKQGGYINFVGWQNSEVVRNLLALSDIFVLPSRSEACPIALLEAMAMEVTCVASEVGDVKQIFSSSNCGFTFSPNSPIALREAIKLAASIGVDGRREMGRLARAGIETKYSSENMAQYHLDLYLEVFREVRY